MIYNRPQLPATGTISRADLQRLVDDFTVTLDADDVADVADDLSASTAGINWLVNSDFRAWSVATSVSLPLTWAETADGWYARGTYTDGSGSGTGASPSPTNYITLERSEDAVHDHVIYCASITGDTTGASTRIGQRLSSSVAAAMLEGQATITIELENKTGSVQTPTLVFEACSTRDDYSATSELQTWSLGTIANNARTTFTETINLSAFPTEVRNGGILFVKLEGLNDAAHEWRVYYSRLEPGIIASPRRIERDSSASTSTTTSATENYLFNSDLSRWMATPVTAIEDADNATAEGWSVIPADGSLATVSRDIADPNDDSVFALKIVGDATVSTTVDIAQDLPRSIAGGLATDLTFSVYIYNGTGSSFTPSFVLDTCDTANSSTRTNVIEQLLQTCASAAWTQVQWTFDPQSYANFVNGARLALRLPSGVLDSGAKTASIAQPRLQLGSSAVAYTPAAAWTPGPLASTAATAKGLRISWASNTTISVACSAAVCERADGTLRTIRNLASTINIASSGANGIDTGSATASKWYRIYLITDEVNVAAIMQREDSATALVLPAGYRWASGVVGLVRLNAGVQVPDFAQIGNVVNTPPIQIVDAVRGTANAWELITVAAGADTAIPLAAVACSGSYGLSTAGTARISISTGSPTTGNAQYGQQSIVGVTGAGSYATDGFNSVAAPFQMQLTLAQSLYIKADTTAMKTRVTISSYELP